MRSGFLALALLAVFPAASYGTTFTLISFGDPPLSNGGTVTHLGNGIVITLPNATVGDPVDPLRFGRISIVYTLEDLPFFANQMNIGFTGTTSGSGFIAVSELVYDYTGGFEGNLIGVYNQIYQDPNGALRNWTIGDSFALNPPSRDILVKKTILLSAQDTAAFDLATVNIVNQAAVPEPATLAALGAGLGLLAARRRARKA